MNAALCHRPPTFKAMIYLREKERIPLKQVSSRETS